MDRREPMNSSEEDVELVASILAGDEAAFDRFFDGSHPRLYRFALRRLGGDRAAAEDVAQATILRAIDALPSYRGEAALLTWLFTLCRREIATGRRTSRIETRLTRIEDEAEVRAGLESLAGDAEDETARAAARLEREEAVQVALDYLPEDYAAALEAKYLREESVEQVAARLGRTVKATESLLTRAREMFRDAMTQLYGAGAAEALRE
jgi:RNA polymerase sigma-70 factor (ECF subfamily)